MQMSKERMYYCDQQTTTRRAVQSMHQSEPVPFLSLGTRTPEQLNGAITDPAPTVYRKTRGLVQYQKVTVFIDHALFDPLYIGPVGHRGAALRGSLKRRNSDLVSGDQAPARPGPTLVYAHLATSDYPVNQRPRKPLQSGQQKVIEAPIGVVGINSQRLGGGFFHIFQGSKAEPGRLKRSASTAILPFSTVDVR